MKILLNRSVKTVYMQIIASVLLKIICEQFVRICTNAHSPVQQKKIKKQKKMIQTSKKMKKNTFISE